MKLRSIPFGYQMTNGEIAPHPQEADVVRQIFNLYINGLGYKAIMKRLSTGEVCYHPGRPWNQNMIKRILENRRYLGEQDYPALIDAADFAAVDTRKANNPRCQQTRRERPEPSFDYRLLPFEPSTAVRRLTQEINRALERAPEPERARPLIFACAAEKYASIGVIINGQSRKKDL